MSNKNLIEYQEAPLRRVCVSGNAAENIEDERERARERERGEGPTSQLVGDNRIGNRARWSGRRVTVRK